MSEPILCVMCGLSGSGKSTIARNSLDSFNNPVIVSSDVIREELTGKVEDQSKNDEVFKLFHERIRKNLENKHDVIVDATNLTMKSRRAIMMKINGLDVHKICYVIPKPFEECKKDNINREHLVPNEVLEKQIRRFQIPFKEEGFDEIFIHDCEEWDKYKLSNLELLAATYNFDQKNLHHTMTLDKHCMNAYRLFSKARETKCLFLQDYIDGFVMGAKLHDIGKVSTQTFDDDGIAHYYNHPEVGSYVVLSQMKTPLTWDDNTLLDCCFLINYHMMPFNWDSDKARERWKKRFGEDKYKLLLDFNECDKAR